MIPIESVEAWEVLDSRGNPTVRVRVDTARGDGTFTVPAGASTGTHEAVEVRDGGSRYGGLGVRDAVRAVNSEVAPMIEGRDVTAQTQLDLALRELDGTEDLSRIGANAILGVSGAVATAASASSGIPLYAYLADGEPGRLPLPMVNLLSGGLHAEGGIEIQDFLVVPHGAATYSEAIESVWQVRAAVRERITDAGNRPLLADEGGFAPPLAGIEAAFDLCEAGMRDAGFKPGVDMGIAVDVAATHLYDAAHDQYELTSQGDVLDTAGMIDLIEGWVSDRPLVAVEDPLAEDAWAGWQTLTERIGEAVSVIGDDLLVTDPIRIRQAIERQAANAVLIKPNQVGTLTDAFEASNIAKDHGMGTILSARSGETSDATIADLAVALDTGVIKIGSLARSERLAKYNRLLEIERQHDAEFASDAL